MMALSASTIQACSLSGTKPEVIRANEHSREVDPYTKYQTDTSHEKTLPVQQLMVAHMMGEIEVLV
jgi:hypothetical protein